MVFGIFCPISGGILLASSQEGDLLLEPEGLSCVCTRECLCRSPYLLETPGWCLGMTVSNSSEFYKLDPCSWLEPPSFLLQAGYKQLQMQR